MPTRELRPGLLALITNGGASDFAAQHLDEIDKIRDEYGAPDSELRHPDLESGKGWPIIGHVTAWCSFVKTFFLSHHKIRAGLCCNHGAPKAIIALLDTCAWRSFPVEELYLVEAD